MGRRKGGIGRHAGSKRVRERKKTNTKTPKKSMKSKNDTNISKPSSPLVSIKSTEGGWRDSPYNKYRDVKFKRLLHTNDILKQ